MNDILTYPFHWCEPSLFLSEMWSQCISFQTSCYASLMYHQDAGPSNLIHLCCMNCFHSGRLEHKFDPLSWEDFVSLNLLQPFSSEYQYMYIIIAWISHQMHAVLLIDLSAMVPSSQWVAYPWAAACLDCICLSSVQLHECCIICYIMLLTSTL